MTELESTGFWGFGGILSLSLSLDYKFFDEFVMYVVVVVLGT